MLATFIADRMSSYIAGGMGAETAAKFTRGELLAIYRKQHYSRDTSGAMRVTPPPENLTPEAAMKKCDAVIAEILNYSAEEHAKAEKHGKALENTPLAQEKSNLSGFEELADYRWKTA